MTAPEPNQRGMPVAEKIEAAFARTFQERGYLGTSVESVARELGIPKGSVFYHIGTKENVFFRVQIAGMRGFVDRLRIIGKYDFPPELRLREVIRDNIRRVDPSAGPLFSISRDSRFLNAEHACALEVVRDEYLALFKEIVCDGIEAGVFKSQEELDVVIFGILRMIGHVKDWYRPDGALSLQEIADLYWEFTCRGLGYEVSGEVTT